VRRFFVSELSRPVCEAEHIHCRISARCKLPVVPIGLRSGALQFRKIRNRFFVVPLLSGGAYASSRTWSGMRWTRKAPKDERRVFRGRRSRVVLARPCRRQVSLEMMRTTVAIKLVHRGEREVSRKPPRREGRRDAALTCGLRAFCASLLRGGPRVHAGTRSSLRPLVRRGASKMRNPGERRCGKAETRRP